MSQWQLFCWGGGSPSWMIWSYWEADMGICITDSEPVSFCCLVQFSYHESTLRVRLIISFRISLFFSHVSRYYHSLDDLIWSIQLGVCCLNTHKKHFCERIIFILFNPPLHLYTFPSLQNCRSVPTIAPLPSSLSPYHPLCSLPGHVHTMGSRWHS